jgi:hypothetical protein
MDKTLDNIHPNAPKRLVSLWRKAGSDRKVAELRGVNHYYVSQLLWRGIEPTTPEVRRKLFLPGKPRKPRDEKPEEFPGQLRIKKGIAGMRKKTTRAVLKDWRSNSK